MQHGVAANTAEWQCTGDLWGLGIAIFVLVSGGRTPFSSAELAQLGSGNLPDEQQRWLNMRLDSVMLHSGHRNLRLLSAPAQVHSSYHKLICSLQSSPHPCSPLSAWEQHDKA